MPASVRRFTQRASGVPFLVKELLGGAALTGALVSGPDGWSVPDDSLAADEGDRIRASYGSKYDRLATIKATYDPQDVFHRNVNTKPA